MAVAFFYSSIAVFLIILVVSHLIKPLRTANYVIGIASIAYSLIFELLLGHIYGLYYYIHPSVSIRYILLSSILLYPILNMIYTLFLPSGKLTILIYTGIWTAAMLFFEYISYLAGTLVFSGWRMLPWSIITYIITYTWVYLLYRYLERKIAPE